MIETKAWCRSFAQCCTCVKRSQGSTNAVFWAPNLTEEDRRTAAQTPVNRSSCSKPYTGHIRAQFYITYIIWHRLGMGITHNALLMVDGFDFAAKRSAVLELMSTDSRGQTGNHIVPGLNPVRRPSLRSKPRRIHTLHYA